VKKFIEKVKRRLTVTEGKSKTLTAQILNTIKLRSLGEDRFFNQQWSSIFLRAYAS